ncbi:hypothetical protein [Metamycoplasma hominis]|uniref:hypothetical protein n=1 Tax=Metamycoplasma hominis TaxID=2098 RepID=UPI00404343A4
MAKNQDKKMLSPEEKEIENIKKISKNGWHFSYWLLFFILGVIAILIWAVESKSSSSMVKYPLSIIFIILCIAMIAGMYTINVMGYKLAIKLNNESLRKCYLISLIPLLFFVALVASFVSSIKLKEIYIDKKSQFQNVAIAG